MKKNEFEVGKVSLYRANTPVLSVRGLSLIIDTPAKKTPRTIIDSLNLDLPAGSITGIYGQTGAGKTLLGLAIMALLPADLAGLVKGSVIFEGNDLRQMAGKAMTNLYANKLAIMFQNPQASLNPNINIASQLSQAGRMHHHLDAKQAKERAVNLLQLVGFLDPKSSVNAYPHHLSLSMSQRLILAIAISCSPQVLIADDPFSSLDDEGRAHCMGLLSALAREFNTAVLILSHNKDLLASWAQKSYTLSAGKLEEGLSS